MVRQHKKPVTTTNDQFKMNTHEDIETKQHSEPIKTNMK